MPVIQESKCAVASGASVLWPVEQVRCGQRKLDNYLKTLYDTIRVGVVSAREQMTRENNERTNNYDRIEDEQSIEFTNKQTKSKRSPERV